MKEKRSEQIYYAFSLVASARKTKNCTTNKHQNTFRFSPSSAANKLVPATGFKTFNVVLRCSFKGAQNTFARATECYCVNALQTATMCIAIDIPSDDSGILERVKNLIRVSMPFFSTNILQVSGFSIALCTNTMACESIIVESVH